MNYRQWKKNHKKQHGYNPPMEEDKRKQRKAASKVIPALSETLKNMVPILREGIAIYFETLSKASAQVAKNLRGGV